jgi:hypothetical protein
MMTKKKKIVFAGGLLFLLIFIPAFWFLVLPVFMNTEINEALPQAASDELVFTHKGDFEKVDYSVQGGFEIYKKDGKNILRINNLDILNGPDLHFVFSNEKSSFTKNYEIIKELPANKGSYNVEIPENLNPDNFQYLLIHCVRFRHTFAGANIQKK